jgi:hypothetical protein
MRGLTKGQKKLLDTQNGITHADDMSPSAWENLEDLNDYETLYQDASRYLYDNYIETLQKDKW